MNEDFLKTRLQTSAQLASLLAIVAYVVGFLVLSIHQASFGISQFGLLRVRIISAGLLFCAFVAFPAVETVRFATLKRFSATENTEPKILRQVKALPTVLLPLIGASVILRTGLMGSSFVSRTYWVWSLGAIVLAAIVTSLPDFLKMGAVFDVIRFVAVLTAVGYCFYRTGDAPLWSLAGWFVWCAVATLEACSPLKEPWRLRFVNLLQSVLGAIITVGLFGLLIYPRVPPAVGGGAPFPATLSFADDTRTPIGAARQISVWMLDETDTGFYLLQTKGAKNAVFIPRAEVRAIYYGSEPSAPAVETVRPFDFR